ncbi:MAG TPA: hypothetical protein GXX40_05580 [Firmicutes bacterium]|nr:hypothetical protein [Bacillota bacterium]
MPGASPVSLRDGKPTSDVNTYFVGEFVYYGSTSTYLKLDPKGGVRLSTALSREVEAANVLDKRWRVGVDRQRGLIELRPVPDSGRRTQGLFAGYVCRRKAGDYMRIGSPALVAWLIEQGVPTGKRIPARWQPQTGSIVGRYVDPVAEPSTNPALALHRRKVMSSAAMQ